MIPRRLTPQAALRHLHRRRLPLASLDFERMLAEDRAQGRLFPRGGEGNECAGVCFS